MANSSTGFVTLAAVVVFVTAAGRAGAADAEVQFNRDVRPILSEKCFACHGFDAKHRKAGLRLDTGDGAYAKSDSGAPAIEPGKPDKSEVWSRISSADADEVMPPPKSHKTLSKAEKKIIRTWIALGAKYEKHWAFVPPTRPAVPKEPQAVTPIDAFVIQRLSREGLALSPETDRPTLLRRVTLDLTGLPPTPEEVDGFVSDQQPGAYERQVDRLLASPRYGERMAVRWLDLARYGDTNGYLHDIRRTGWPWRDWVIKAFNDDMPFDRFVIEQLAGDLLPHATQDQILATAFSRNHRHHGRRRHDRGRISERVRSRPRADDGDGVPRTDVQLLPVPRP